MKVCPLNTLIVRIYRRLTNSEEVYYGTLENTSTEHTESFRSIDELSALISGIPEQQATPGNKQEPTNFGEKTP